MKQIKQIICSLILIIVSSSTYCQVKSTYKNISKEEKVQILKSIGYLDKAFKESNIELFKGHLSADFSSMGESMPIATNIVGQMINQMPKGNFQILRASKTTDGLFEMDIKLVSRMDIHFSVKLDSQFKFIKLDYIE